MSTPSLVRMSVLAGVSALSLAVLAAPALADPPPGHPPVTIAGVGSDTTQDVMNAIAKAYNSAGKPGYLASYDAIPKGATMPDPNSKITPKPGCPTIVRPAGSSAGITALLDDTHGCIDFARSSRTKSTTGSENSLTFFAYGRDGVTWAAKPSTHTPTTLTPAQLKSIYTCTKTNWKQIQSSLPSNTIKPFLPQVGSGTRSFFETAIGITDAQVGSCVNQSAIENDGRVIKGNVNALLPYSVAKDIAQTNRVGGLANITAGVTLRKINGIAPTTGSGARLKLNKAFPANFLRLVFNVTKKASDGSATLTDLFGSTGFVCSQQSIITKYGFLSLGAGCGTQF